MLVKNCWGKKVLKEQRKKKNHCDQMNYRYFYYRMALICSHPLNSIIDISYEESVFAMLAGSTVKDCLER